MVNMEKKYIETHYRSLIKSITWRVTGTLDTILISFIVTGKIKIALSIGMVELITKTGLYYLHERIWNKIKCGKKEEAIEYNI